MLMSFPLALLPYFTLEFFLLGLKSDIAFLEDKFSLTRMRPQNLLDLTFRVQKELLSLL